MAAKDVKGRPWVFTEAGQAEGRANTGWDVFSTFTTTNATNHIDLTGHGFQTGDGPLRMTTSAADLPSGYSINTDYWAIYVDADNFKVASSYANALAETAVAIADDGTGTHKLTMKSLYPRPIFVKTILIDAASTGGAFNVTEKSGGRSLTGILNILANKDKQIVIDDYVEGIYITSIADGQILVYHGE